MSVPSSEHSTYILNDYTLYWPLKQERDEIRLLRIKTEPADSDVEVTCYLTYASLLDTRVPKAYTCLSYCWGDTSKTRKINVVRPDECLHDGTCEGEIFRFSVTVNLETALRKVRSMTARPLVWADAVCIDQSNLAERAHQVSMMQTIYSKSMQTLIWLGDASFHSDMAMDFAIFIRKVLASSSDIVANSSAAGIYWSRLIGLLKGELSFSQDEIDCEDFKLMRTATQALLSYPWFRRVWVLQEVCRSSSTVAIAGHKACQWEDIRNLGIWENRVKLQAGDIPWADIRTPTMALSLVPDAESNNDLPEIWWFLASEFRSGRFPAVLELIFRRGQIQASDPRDQVFALFGIMKECQGEFASLDGYHPDYSKTTAQVYTDFTRAVIISTQSLEVLSAVNTFLPQGRYRADLPSWVPEYDHHFNLRRSLAFLGLKGYNTARKTPIGMGMPAEPNSLSLRGVAMDFVKVPDDIRAKVLQVRKSIDSHVRDLICDTSISGIKNLWDVISGSQESPHFAEEDLLEQFILTLICSREDQRQRTTAATVKEIPRLVADFAAYWKRYEADFGSLPARSSIYESHQELEMLSSTASAVEFGRRLMWTCDSRCLLMTRGNRIGLFPRQAKSGDLIVVFFGGNVPYVIRQMGTLRSPWYQLVGECYVHGRMDGSVIEELDAGLRNTHLFDLR